MNYKNLLASAAVIALAANANADLLITEIVDATLTGGQPKFVELTNTGAASVDLSLYSLGNFNNGGTTLGGGASTALTGTLAAGASYIICYEADPGGAGLSNYSIAFGTECDFYMGGGFVNGDDVIALFLGVGTGDGTDATTVDICGELGVDGTGTAWEWIDSYTYRCGNTANGGVFNIADWTFAGANFLETGCAGDDACELAALIAQTTPGVHAGSCASILYNRGMASEGISFTPAGIGLFDVSVTANYFNVSPSPLDLSMDLELTVNGTSIGVAYLAASGPVGMNQNCCPGGCQSGLDCVPIPGLQKLNPALPDCICMWPAFAHNAFTGVPLMSGDVVGVSLAPSFGAAPELFGSDDSVEIIFGGPGTPLCFGDGANTPCPCGNVSAAGEGCVNSTGAGAVMTAAGSVTASAGDLVLSGSQFPASVPALFFSGLSTITPAVTLGDGLRCAGGQITRIQVAFTDASGNVSTTANIAAVIAATAGSTNTMQIWFRDASGGAPCGSGFNTSNAMQFTWN